jgi:hypothetical protein
MAQPQATVLLVTIKYLRIVPAPYQDGNGKSYSGEGSLPILSFF